MKLCAKLGGKVYIGIDMRINKIIVVQAINQMFQFKLDLI